MNDATHILGIDPDRSHPQTWLNNAPGREAAWEWWDQRTNMRVLYFANRSAHGFILGDELVGTD